MDSFTSAFNNAHGIEFDEYRFDEPDYQALMVTEETYLEHLRVQSAGLAYYGTLAKNAEREYDVLEQRYRMRYNEMYSECSDIIYRSGKKGVKDVEALIQCKYENELSTWHNELDESRSRKDGAASYYEAWKAKGFALNSMTSLITAGLLGPKQTITEEDIGKAREKRMNIQDAHGILSGKNRNI